MWLRRHRQFSFLFWHLTFNRKLTVHGYYSSCTLLGTGTGTGVGTGTENNGFLYYTMYCTHNTGTGTGHHWFYCAHPGPCPCLCPGVHEVGKTHYMDISPCLIHETGWHKGVKYLCVWEVIGIVNRIALQKAIHLITLPPCLLPGTEQFSWPSRVSG